MSFQEPQHEVVEPVPVPKDKSPKAEGSFNAFTAIVLGYKYLPRVLLASLILCIVALLAIVIPLEVISHRSRHPKAQSVIFNPVSPPSFPLAVRNPYVSAWMPGDLVDILPRAEVQFWAGQYLTWSITARVNGVTFNLMGVPNPTNGTKDATVTHAQYTSTHSIFTLKAGAATFNLDFLSPVSPSNYLRQSLPFSYVTINATTSSGTNIQMFSDIDDTWTGQSMNSSWTLNTTTDTSIFSINANNVATYSQNSMDQALWGEVIFASRNISSNITLQTGPQLTVRGQFATQGNLTGEMPNWTPGGITGEGGVVGIAHDLGLVNGEASVQYAIGYVREEAVNYLGSPYTGYYRATYPNTIDAVTHFFNDYEAAYTESLIVDSTISSKSTGIAGQNYSDIVALSLRQAYGGLELTIPNDTLNTSSILAFIKEISSDGNVNTVDVIFPAFPMYYAIDPEYIRLLLEPIMLYLAAGRWPHSYVIHDIGSDYPNATGHDNGKAEAMPIEETGNLLILIYAYTLATNNTSWAANYTSLLQGYADYLVSNSLNITKQLSTNDAAGPLRNETNLAVKAAIGLKAFGALTGLSNYSAIGDAHANILYDQGLATDENKTHFTLTYPNNATSWKVTFNLYPDLLLNLSTFPQSAYDMESSFYPTVRREGGVGLDDRQWWAKTDWNLWAAGTSGNETRNMFVNDVWSMMTYGLNTWPFSDRYIVSGEGENEGRRLWGEWALRARPTVGGHFSLLALKGARYLAWGD